MTTISVQRGSFEGAPLPALVYAGLPDLVILLRVAVSLVDALASIHDRGLVHCHIEPRNVLVDVVTGAVKLLGLGTALPDGAYGHGPCSKAAEPWRLSPEGPTLPSGGLEGDLAYISPEQTGRMSCAVDYRSDFYSLGAVLYEMFTRRRPFAMDDPLQLVHAHLARRPTPPHEVEPTVPEALSGVVLKLLAKDVDERYQSHRGVRADLAECLTALERGERPRPFAPGRWDVSARFHIPRRLYGRERELAMLLAAFERAAGGGVEVVCITGYAGVGKSALVREIRVPFAARGGYYLAGKYDQLRRGAPYSALIEALRDLVRQLLMERAEALASVRARLREALGESGQVLTAAIPEIEAIIGPQGPVQALPSVEAQNRFNRVLGRFIGVFGRPGRPLVLFLDDLQWADSASLEFLQQLVSSEICHLLVLAAYRDNEVGPGHPIESTFAAMRAGHRGGHPQNPGVQLGCVELAPLDTTTLMRLVADTLHVSADECAKLGALLHAKTAGNPFFATELLKTLHQEGAIAFDAGAGRWRSDGAAIEAASVTDNVVDLMCRKIGKLSEIAQEVLKEAACIDNTFALETLGVAGGRPALEVSSAIQEARKAGLLLPAGDGAYRFLHDRVQQAAYSLIPEEARVATHLRIGRLLLGDRADAELGERLFDVVDHLNRGRARLCDDGERLRLARLNLLAGRRAKASAAFEPAYGYLDVGVELLDAAHAGRAAHPELAAALLAGRGECAHLAARFDDAARDFREAMALVDGDLERAGILELEMRMHSTRGDHERVIATALEGVRILGFECPEHPGKAAVAAELLRIKWRLRGRTTDDLLALPVMPARSPRSPCACS
jgi:predicted ATPase